MAVVVENVKAKVRRAVTCCIVEGRVEGDHSDNDGPRLLTVTRHVHTLLVKRWTGSDPGVTSGSSLAEVCEDHPEISLNVWRPD